MSQQTLKRFRSHVVTYLPYLKFTIHTCYVMITRDVAYGVNSRRLFRSENSTFRDDDVKSFQSIERLVLYNTVSM
jgi:hypothetical protein